MELNELLLESIAQVPTQYVYIMNKEVANDFCDHLISKPTDKLEVSDNLDERLISIVRNITGQKEEDDSDFKIPIDIVFADNIPLKSVEFKFHNIAGRVTLFDDEYRHMELQQVIDGKKQMGAIGIVSVYVTLINMSQKLEVFCVIYVEAGTNMIVVKPDLGFKGPKAVTDIWYSYRFDMLSIDVGRIFRVIDDVRYIFTAFWYAVNVLLQNPVIKKCISTGREPILSAPSKKHKGGKQPPKKYIRRIYINTNKMDKEDIVINAKPKSTKTKPLWYVTGHWRHYSNGKKIFIQGYWKGVARDLKNCDTRDRELVFDNDKKEYIYE